MSQFRTLKTNNITNSDEHTTNLRNKTIYTSAKNSSLGKKKNGATYNSTIAVNQDGCLIATDSFNTYLTMAKGNNLCNMPDISYSVQGQMNEANIIAVDTSGMANVYPTRTSGDPANANKITYPLAYDCSCGDIYQSPGVTIDPSYQLVNEVTCENNPYIHNLNPETDTLIYDLSNNSTQTNYYTRINKANNKLQEFYLSSRIKL